MSHVTQKTATTRINARHLSAMCIENPRVGSSILPQATKFKWYILKTLFTVYTGHIVNFNYFPSIFKTSLISYE